MQLISKKEFVEYLDKVGVDVDNIQGELINFECISEISEIINQNMPGIGFASVNQIINCFYSVCRNIDDYIEDGEIDIGESQIILTILRIKNKRFEKAITMFDLRANRVTAADRRTMPKSAIEYLAGIRMHG